MVSVYFSFLVEANSAAEIKPSVTPDKAETTTTTLFSDDSFLTIFSTKSMFWAFATEVPPNFRTFIMYFFKEILNN